MTSVVNRIDRALAARKKAGQSGLIIYITAGYPDLDTTNQLLPALFEAGADVVEIGMPFSDPLADGPTIQSASQKALAGGIRLAHVLDLLSQHRRNGLDEACALLCYVNPLMANGYWDNPEPLAAAGFDGLIVPDLPQVERREFEKRCLASGMHLIPFLTPTSSPGQVAEVAGGQGGFVYYISVTGVTGRRQVLPPTLRDRLQEARSVANRPIAVGFGVSGPAQAKMLSRYCDAVIVGSALTERIADAADPVAAAVRFVAELRRALDEVITD